VGNGGAAAPSWVLLGVFFSPSLFFLSRKGAIFFLEEKETGPLQLEVVGVN